MAETIATRPAADGTGYVGRRRVVALAATAVVLPVASAIPSLTPALGDPYAYAAVTLAVFVALAGAGAALRRCDDGASQSPAAAVAVAAVGVVAIAWLSHGWFDIVLHQPIDPFRGDMLVVIRQALHRLMLGRDPYAMYDVPWQAPLPYGPVLWAPFLVPEVLRVDLRVVTLVGALVLPALMVGAAAAFAARRRWLPAAGVLAIAAAWLVNPDLGRFVPIGHTPAYWALIPFFAWLVAEERWTAAAALLGLLVVARTTMVAIVPVFAIAAWQRDRRHAVAAAVAFAAPVVALLLPFALWNWSTFEYGLYGSYQQVMKGFVWTQTDWTQHSIGLTGFLIRAHLSRYVEAVQVAALAVTYAWAWRALRRGAEPGGWMAVALCVFSMTTLWPVMYVYFDVVILLASAAVFASAAMRRSVTPLRMAAGIAVVVLAVPIALRAAAPAEAAVDVGTPQARRALAAGFSTDEREGPRTFAWIDGREARLFVPRFSRGAATLAIVAAPAAIAGAPPQEMTVVVNGATVGTRTMVPGWQEIRFEVPARSIVAGLNDIRLYFRSAVSPREAGTGDDPRRLSAAVDSVGLYSSARLVPSS